MVRLHPYNGINPFGNGVDGAGPASGNLANALYNYTSWAITGVINCTNANGTVFRVMGDVSISSADDACIATVNLNTTVDHWGTATNGAAPAAGANCGVASILRESVFGPIATNYHFFQEDGAGAAQWHCAGAGGLQATTYGRGSGRLLIFAGGTITIAAKTAGAIVAIDAGGSSGVNANGSHGGGGGGGGIVCLISNTAILIPSTGYTTVKLSVKGGNGGNGSGTKYSGGGGGGGAIILCAPTITIGDVANEIKYTGGFSGSGSTMAGAGNGGGGGGSFGAGGVGGSVGTANGGDGVTGKYFTFNKFHSMKPF